MFPISKMFISGSSPIENHYLAKFPDVEESIISDADSVVRALKSLCELMDRRYDLLKAAKVRNIRDYNRHFLPHNPIHDTMPYIVVIIDEYADYLKTAGRDVAEPVTRLAQMARAVGIHLVITTQKTTPNIITGSIKANFPARIAFKVMSAMDSKAILNQKGAENLTGCGDMLFDTGVGAPVHVQCTFIDAAEINRLTDFISSQTV